MTKITTNTVFTLVTDHLEEREREKGKENPMDLETAMDHMEKVVKEIKGKGKGKGNSNQRFNNSTWENITIPSNQPITAADARILQLCDNGNESKQESQYANSTSSLPNNYNFNYDDELIFMVILI